MPGHFPTLDSESLARLRRLVGVMRSSGDRSLPVSALIELAREVQLDAGVTVDFKATRELGEPMVVLRMPASREPAACLDGLSKREREVAALVTEGLSNKQIAVRLFIALATVKDHVHRILASTGLSNRAAIAAAYNGHSPTGFVADKTH